MSAAEELGLEAAPDGHMLLLQLPPLLPSVPLFEAGQRAALEEPAPPSTPPLPDGAKPHPKFAVGPDVLKHIPSGKARTPRPPFTPPPLHPQPPPFHNSLFFHVHHHLVANS